MLRYPRSSERLTRVLEQQSSQLSSPVFRNNVNLKDSYVREGTAKQQMACIDRPLTMRLLDRDEEFAREGSLPVCGRRSESKGNFFSVSMGSDRIGVRLDQLGSGEDTKSHEISQLYAVSTMWPDSHQT